jgi:hypothetical protein
MVSAKIKNVMSGFCSGFAKSFPSQRKKRADNEHHDVHRSLASCSTWQQNKQVSTTKDYASPLSTELPACSPVSLA